MPLALYLLFLSFLNQRQRPTLMSGPWDFTCVLLGLSGFIVLGGPMLLSTLDSAWRSYWFGGNFSRVREEWSAHSALWSRIGAGYVIALGCLIGITMNLRRKVTVIYNLDPSAIEDMLIAALDVRGLGCRRLGGGFEIGKMRHNPHLVVDENALAKKPPVLFSGPTAFVRIDRFSSLKHASLKWLEAEPLLRGEVESELDKIVSTTESPPNPAGGWFMTAAISLFFVMLLWMAFLVYTMIVNGTG